MNRPIDSFSIASSSGWSNSTSGIGGCWVANAAAAPLPFEPPPKSSESKIEPWPISRSCWAFCPAPCACSSTISMPLRVAPVEPNAPHLISASIDFLLTVRQSTRAQKSHSDSNGPPSSRAALIASTAEKPTPLTASRPKRMLPSETTKSWSERLTSGGRISMPICSACVAKNGTLSFVDMTELISAAMYSAG